MDPLWFQFHNALDELSKQGTTELVKCDRAVSFWLKPLVRMERVLELRRMPYDEFLRTPEWYAIRHIALLRAGGRCQTCDSDLFLETHHRTYERRGHEELGDLIVLCSACHTAVHLVIDARAGKKRPISKRARV